MELKRFKLVAAVAMIVAMVGVMSASAATLSLSLEYYGSFTDEYASEPATYALVDGAIVDAGDMVTVLPASVVAPTDIHQFNIYYSLDPSAPPALNAPNPTNGWTPEHSLQQLILDVKLGAGLTQASGLPYTPYMYPDDPTGRFDPPPTGSGGGAARSLYTDNSDGTGNLERIMATTDGLAAHGLDPGEAEPKLMGWFYLNWTPGADPTSVSLIPSASAPVDPWLLWVNGYIDTKTPYTHSTGDAYAPPASDMYGSVNSGSGFEFDMTGDFDLPPGIPEPSTIALFGLAFVGLFGLIRRS
jgi:hypothetical protein